MSTIINHNDLGTDTESILAQFTSNIAILNVYIILELWHPEYDCANECVARHFGPPLGQVSCAPGMLGPLNSLRFGLGPSFPLPSIPRLPSTLHLINRNVFTLVDSIKSFSWALIPVLAPFLPSLPSLSLPHP